MKHDRVGRLYRQAGLEFGCSIAYPLLSNEPDVGVRMGIAEFAPGTVETAQPYNEAIYLLDGELEIEGDGETHLLKAGDSLWMPRGHPILYRARQPCRFVYVIPTGAAPAA